MDWPINANREVPNSYLHREVVCIDLSLEAVGDYDAALPPWGSLEFKGFEELEGTIEVLEELSLTRPEGPRRKALAGPTRKNGSQGATWLIEQIAYRCILYDRVGHA